MEGHGHGPSTPPAVVRGRRALVLLVVLIVAGTCAGMWLLWPPADGGAQPRPDSSSELVDGTITAVRAVPCVTADGAVPPPEVAGLAPERGCTEVVARVDEGADRGTVFASVTASQSFRRVGTRVVLYVASDPSLPAAERYSLADVQRGTPLLALAGLFLAAVVALGRWRGLMAVAGLGVSLLVLVEFLVPALLAGRPPLLTAVVGASAVMVVVLLLAHGPSLRTATAMIGTASALLLTLGLAAAFVSLAGLTGVTSEEAGYVEATFRGVDLRGLLLAGIVVGALGILDDVTVTQVSAVYELRAADPAMSRGALYAAGLRVGRDHVASTVNTLLLAYAGASMPLLVIVSSSGTGWVDTVTSGFIAEEVVRTLVGSIGLVAAVPLTTALAAATSPPTAQPAAPG